MALGRWKFSSRAQPCHPLRAGTSRGPLLAPVDSGYSFSFVSLVKSRRVSDFMALVFMAGFAEGCWLMVADL
jgi:hypothetical protein